MLVYAMVAGAAVSAAGTVYAAEKQSEAADAAADQAKADANAAMGEARVMAEKIRKAGKRQQSEAVAALAASGVEVQTGTAEQIQEDIATRVEEDALTELLSGSRRSRALGRESELLSMSGDAARTAGYINATGTVLSSVSAYQRGDWRRRS